MGEVRTIKKILVTVDYSGETWEKLAGALIPAEIVRLGHSDTPGILNAIQDVDAAILGGDITLEELRAARQIKWIHCDHAGLNNSAHPEIFERGIILTSSSGRSAPVLAEHAFFFMLSLVYGSRAIEDNQRSHVWQNISENRRGLITKTLGIIGMGKTGKEIAKRAKIFGMRVLGYSRSSGEIPEGVEKMYREEQGDTIDPLLRECDIIVLSVSLSDKTWHLIDERAFGLMKPTAYLVNMARGAVVDQDALYRALAGGRIAGAGSDVFEEEPLPSSSPLWDLPNMIITSHNTPAVADRNGFSLRVIIDNIKAFREGGVFKNALDARDVYTRNRTL
jgi:phosphoglycerate dehydrogenase-like enzyme